MRISRGFSSSYLLLLLALLVIFPVVRYFDKKVSAAAQKPPEVPIALEENALATHGPPAITYHGVNEEIVIELLKRSSDPVTGIAAFEEIKKLGAPGLGLVLDIMERSDYFALGLSVLERMNFIPPEGTELFRARISDNGFPYRMEVARAWLKMAKDDHERARILIDLLEHERDPSAEVRRYAITECAKLTTARGLPIPALKKLREHPVLGPDVERLFEDYYRL